MPSAPTTFRTTNPDVTVTATSARAFAYLRVSSEGQVKTDYSDDDLSIDAQREGAEEKSASLEAEIVREFSDPGRSAYVDLHKRTGFLEMLDELKHRNEHPAPASSTSSCGHSTAGRAISATTGRPAS